jgi:hypothetical protein
LETALEELEQLDLAGLKQAWRRHLSASPPPLRSRDLMRRMLAFELQAAVYGGLTADTKQQLRAAARPQRAKPLLQPGTTITREWRGTSHVVEVRDDQFEHQGTTYASLSEVARAITGARWSGPRFFGLKENARKLAA